MFRLHTAKKNIIRIQLLLELKQSETRQDDIFLKACILDYTHTRKLYILNRVMMYFICSQSQGIIVCLVFVYVRGMYW